MQTVVTTTTAPAAPPAPSPPGVAGLPVHPRRPGWRAGAAAALVAFAVSELRAGRSPHRDVTALAQLGGGALPAGAAAAQELDRRLAAAVSPLVDDLHLQRARSAAFDGPPPPGPLLDDELADVVAGTLFDRLDARAVVGRPHPGEWVASSVDVVPCAVHGYEDGPVDCLRRAVRAHLSGVVDRATGTRTAFSASTLGELVTAAGARADDPDGPAGDPVVAALWTGVAALAAWQAHAATR